MDLCTLIKCKKYFKTSDSDYLQAFSHLLIIINESWTDILSLNFIWRGNDNQQIHEQPLIWIFIALQRHAFNLRDTANIYLGEKF